MQICRYDKITNQFECKFCDFSIIGHVLELSFRIHHEFFIPAGIRSCPSFFSVLLLPALISGKSPAPL